MARSDPGHVCTEHILIIQRSRALAQKLSIRLGKQYSHSKLIEVHSHSLFSKFFGESGKLVGVLFEEVERLLEKEKETFVCILIDEVESLTSARDQAAGRHEPRDALRVSVPLMALGSPRAYKDPRP